MAYDFRVCKQCKHEGAAPTYVLPRAGTIFACRHCKLHYLDYLDNAQVFDDVAPAESAVQKHAEYIDRVLQFNLSKFEDRVGMVKRHVQLAGMNCLDIGAGGGVFLDLLRSEDAHVCGLEPDALNRRFARDRYGLELHAELVDDPVWDSRQEFFDLVTLWDVIEHVNFPRETLASAAKLLKPGGVLGLDTPARDAFLYRAGEGFYRLSGGHLTSLLEVQYSRQPFGHKQIFASRGLLELLRSLGFTPVYFTKLHELSFPYRSYLQRILRSEVAARVADPLAHAFFRCVPVRNKMVLLARKS